MTTSTPVAADGSRRTNSTHLNTCIVAIRAHNPCRDNTCPHHSPHDATADCESVHPCDRRDDVGEIFCCFDTKATKARITPEAKAALNAAAVARWDKTASMTTEKLYHCKLCARHGFLKRTAHRPPPGVSGVSCPGDFAEITPTTCHTCHFASKHGQACPDATIIHRAPWSGCQAWMHSYPSVTSVPSPLPTVANESRETALVSVPHLRTGKDDQIAAQLESYIAEAEAGTIAILKAGFFIECIAEDLPHGQLGPWIEAHCPTRKWRTIRRWKQVAASVAEEIGVSYKNRTALRLHEILSLPLASVPDHARPIREKIDDLISGRSYRQLFMEFKQTEDSLTPKRGRLAGHGGPARQLTTHEQAELLRQTALTASGRMGQAVEASNKDFFLLTHTNDLEVISQIALLESALQLRRAWLATPKAHRLAPSQTSPASPASLTTPAPTTPDPSTP